ncbi:hypothetical protein [Psychroflexus sediminis]|uniref:Uncharacterized protein n=1 Tax=Psychroflexus sediminis TaxID=470826 RepID=A0A1G7TZY8_9FLAO|nr:hypothetical protein [Psychroflexus sediminis]SDG40369.1 hypothetical protein SAMN04488027_101141 [Psychroflexus sediminis]
MNRQLKLIWDFRGPHAEKTAEHHEIHLKDFLKMNAMENHPTGVECLNEFHCLAFLVVEEDQMKDLRDRLKPHRGQVYSG